MSSERPEISLIIPVFNEEAVVEQLFQESVSALSAITENFEIICVDDGSTDNTQGLLRGYHEKDPRFKVLVLSRNFGHQAAYTAGLSYAKGDIVAMMDGDLQDPPELLPKMMEKLQNEGLDVVYGRRTGRKEGFLKRLLMKGFHSIFRKFSTIEYDESVGNFSLFNRKVLNALLAIQEKVRYLPGLRFYVGFKQGYIEYDRADRAAGEAKMTYSNLFSLAFDAIFSFSNLPIKICLYLGFLGIFVFLFGLGYTLVSKYFLDVAPFGWSSQVLSMYFFGSVQLVFLGILGEYIYRIYKEIQQRPAYYVREFWEDK